MSVVVDFVGELEELEEELASAAESLSDSVSRRSSLAIHCPVSFLEYQCSVVVVLEWASAEAACLCLRCFEVWSPEKAQLRTRQSCRRVLLVAVAAIPACRDGVPAQVEASFSTSFSPVSDQLPRLHLSVPSRRRSLETQQAPRAQAQVETAEILMRYLYYYRSRL